MPELLPYAPGSPEWLAARRTGVTATDIVTILGLSSYDSPYSLYWRKMGQVPDEPERDRLELGKALEPYILARWGHEHGGELITAGGLYRHSDRAWQMATLDAQTADDEPIELKSWADADRRAWESGPPAAVRAQNLWQMDVRESARGHVGVVFLPSGEFRSYVIEHRHDPWAHEKREPADRVVCPFVQGGCVACYDLHLMRAAGEEFMQRLRLELPAPDPDASAATLAAVKARFAKAPDKTAEINPNLFEQWSKAKIVRDGMDEQVRRLEIELREQAGEASVYTVDGQPVARRITGDAQVKAHTRHSDYLKRIAPKEADSE